MHFHSLFCEICNIAFKELGHHARTFKLLQQMMAYRSGDTYRRELQCFVCDEILKIGDKFCRECGSKGVYIKTVFFGAVIL